MDRKYSQPGKVIPQLKTQQQYRSLETFRAAGGKPEAQLLSFCANDYLNLAQHAQLKQAAIYAIQHYGCGAASSRLLSGHLEIHQELEQYLAQWSGCYEAALSFGSGYLANCGILSAVIEPGAVVLYDRLNHASLVDGLRLACGFHATTTIRWQRYRHCDMHDLEGRLQKIDETTPIWLITDSVFSMDGDIAPLYQLAQLAHKYRFRWIVDEAHSVGIYGLNGAGLVALLGQNPTTEPIRLPDFVTANFAKALGSYGGYCLCSREWKEYLVNFCRSFIYSTGLPPASAAAALAAIQVIEHECQKTITATKNNEECNESVAVVANFPVCFWPGMVPETLSKNDSLVLISQGLGRELLQRSGQFYQILQQKLPKDFLQPWQSPIIPLILGTNQAALKVASQLREKGILVKAIRSPTVPLGTARLRFSVSLAHSSADLCAAVKAVDLVY